MCNNLNRCGDRYPQMKYYAMNLFTNAVLVRTDTGNCIQINTVEIHGRNQNCEDHAEKDDLSLRSLDQKTRYSGVFLATQSSAVGKKTDRWHQINGHVGNWLIESERICEPEIGPSITSFLVNTLQECNSTRIYISEDPHQEGSMISEDADFDQLDHSNCLHQLRQLRSKFDRPSTYSNQRFYSNDLNPLLYCPYTVFTLAMNTKCRLQDHLSDGKLGSLLLMIIARQVIRLGLTAQLSTEDVQALLLQAAPGYQERIIPQEIIKIQGLLGEEKSMRILYNKALNSMLTSIADKLAP